MNSLLLSLALVLGVVRGAAHPAITPAASLEKRQQQVLSTIWGPTLIQGTVSYKLFTCSSGSTLAASSNNWNCCPSAGTCYMPTSCSAGTIYVAGTSLMCSSVFSNTASNKCGTDILYSSVGGASSYNKIYCAGATDVPTDYYFIQSPSSVRSTTSASSTTSTSPVPTATSPAPKPEEHKTPIGAIVGGVVGGLAVLALVVVGVLLLLKRRKSSTPAPATHSEVAQYPPAGGSDPKHASYATAYPASAPGSPPPMYQNNGVNQAYYGHQDMAAHPGASPYSTEHKGQVPSPGFNAASQYQSQYETPGPVGGAVEMSANSPTAHRGAVELQ